MKAVPPLDEMFGMAGMKLPDYLGTKTDASPVASGTESTSTVDNV